MGPQASPPVPPLSSSEEWNPLRREVNIQLKGLVFSSPKPSLANCSDTVLGVGVYVYMCVWKTCSSPRRGLLFIAIPDSISCPRSDFRGGPRGPRPPFCGLLNISGLHIHYWIQAFANFKRPECTRLYLRELQSQNFPGGTCARNSLGKCGDRSPDRRYRAHIATVYYIYRPPLSRNPPSAPCVDTKCYPAWCIQSLKFSTLS